MRSRPKGERKSPVRYPVACYGDVYFLVGENEGNDEDVSQGLSDENRGVPTKALPSLFFFSH